MLHIPALAGCIWTHNIYTWSSMHWIQETEWLKDVNNLGYTMASDGKSGREIKT